jgi:hypothetical protein
MMLDWRLLSHERREVAMNATGGTRWLLLGLIVSACDGQVENPGGASGGSDAQEPASELVAIDVMPQGAVLYVGHGVAGTQDFTARARYRDGSTGDVTASVGWTLELPLGSFPAVGHLVADGVSGGQTRVHANLGGVDGAATVKVVIRDQHVSEGAPADSATHFGGAADPALAPTLVYPADGVMLPPNLGTIEFQWQPQPTSTLYDLHFTSDYLDLHVYTATNHYTPTAEEWHWLAETHRGAQLGYSVRATGPSGGVGESQPRQLRYAELDVKGGLYYWSATSPDTEGIWRFDFGATAGTAEKYLAENDNGPANVGHCIACHVISHDGTRMAFTNNGSGGPLSVLDVATRDTLPYPPDLDSNFTAFHPDGTRMITTLNGVLTLRDTATGQSIGNLPIPGMATHPDWSADGTRVVYVRTASAGDLTAQNGTLQVIDYNGGAWGAPRTLVAARDATENNYYPQFSPDSNWVVYNRAPDGTSYNNRAAEIWIVRADGRAPPQKLLAAHDTPMMWDSWPRWSPFQTSYEGGAVMWLTVSSRRAYGLELPAGTHAQLWMFAFDSRRAPSGDGSFPAFWLPFQNMQTNNHNAQWTTRILPVGQRF